MMKLLSSILLFVCPLLLVIVIIFVKRPPKPRTVAILVLGDIGRSPRMMYHTESFAQLGFKTFLIGYKGSKPASSLTSLPHVQLCYLPEPIILVPFVLSALLKITQQTISILYVLLFSIPPPEFILVQNPPSIPTLALVQLVARIRGSKVIIDWHNLGFSLLALKLGRTHPFVRIAKRFEETFGRSAYAHLFVTQAMRDHLMKEWKLVGLTAVLHDRPPSHFHRCLPAEIHELFLRLGPSLTDPVLKEFLPTPNTPYATQFTTTRALGERASYSDINMPKLRDDRVALVVSSTSWTPDEDFSILLEALKIYEERAQQVNCNPGSHLTGRLPRIWMVITGKGPLRTAYMSDIARLQQKWAFVRCTSLWLEAEDYPLLLGSADLGICLHSSSSALDLPMKVVDMFGCGLPVCALDFWCLPELVKAGQNGLIFKDAKQLASQIEALLLSFPDSPHLEALRSSLQGVAKPCHLYSDQLSESTDWNWCSWADNWGCIVKPLVLRNEEQLDYVSSAPVIHH
ncbi:glycosyltransferase family 33 protein [Scleroderma yunnanense]